MWLLLFLGTTAEKVVDTFRSQVLGTGNRAYWIKESALERGGEVRMIATQRELRLLLRDDAQPRSPQLAPVKNAELVEDLRLMTGILGATTSTTKIGGKKKRKKNFGKTRRKKRLIKRAKLTQLQASRRYTALGGARVRRCLAATTRAMTEVRMVTALIILMDRHGRTPVATVLSDPGQFGMRWYTRK